MRLWANKRRRFVVALLASLLYAGAVRADAPITPQIGAERRRLQLEVFFGSAKTGLIAGFEQFGDGRMGSKRSELRDIGINPPGDGGPDQLVVLENIPGLSYRYDEPTQSIRIDAPQSALLGRDYRAGGAAEAAPKPRSDFGGVVNYTLYSSTMTRLRDPRLTYQGASANFDARAFSPYGTFSQSAILGSTLSRRAQALRLDSEFSYSDPDTLMTYRVGDAISSGLAWTRPIRLGGAQVQRNFGLRPDLVTLPLPMASGSAAVPSTLDVYVNNVKAYSQEIAPGPYRVTELPLIGDGNARVVLHDATGRRIEQDLQFFTSHLLLRPGFSDYSVELGLPRRNYATDSDNYDKTPVASASLRHGVYDWITAEAHVEATRDLVNAGAGVVARLFDRSIASVAIAGSHSPEGMGGQAYAAFETRLFGVSVNLSSQRVWRNYDDLVSLVALHAPRGGDGGYYVDPYLLYFASRPPRAQDRLSFSFPMVIDPSTVSASLTRLVNADGRRALYANISWSRTVFADVTIFANVFANAMQRRDFGGLVGLSMPLGPKITASSGVNFSRNRPSMNADASRAQDIEIGSYGWRVHDAESRSGDGVRSASASYRAPFARLEAGVSQQRGTASGSLQAEGALASLGEGVFFANRIDDAFAVVNAGSPNVSVYHENRLVGRTGSDGRLLIPYLRSFERNQIAIEPTDLPLNADAPAMREVIAPAYRNGVRVDFGVHKVAAAAVVIFVDEKGKLLAPGANGVLDGSDAHFIVGYDGRAYISGLAGKNTVSISQGGGECRAAFDFHAVQDRQIVIGPVACR